MPQVSRLGQSYAWGDVRLSLFGREVIGVTNIEYDVERELKENYGAGTEPVSSGVGNKKYKGSLSLDMKEVQGILAAMSFPGDLTDIPPFDIIVSVGDDTANRTITDVLRDCRFKSMGRKMKQNDMEFSHEIPLFIMGIEYGR